MEEEEGVELHATHGVRVYEFVRGTFLLLCFLRGSQGEALGWMARRELRRSEARASCGTRKAGCSETIVVAVLLLFGV